MIREPVNLDVHSDGLWRPCLLMAGSVLWWCIKEQPEGWALLLPSPTWLRSQDPSENGILKAVALQIAPRKVILSVKEQRPADQSTTSESYGLQHRKMKSAHKQWSRLPCLQQFSLAKLWNKPRSPSHDDWVKKVCYIYMKEYYTAIKKKFYHLPPAGSKWIPWCQIK